MGVRPEAVTAAPSSAIILSHCREIMMSRDVDHKQQKTASVQHYSALTLAKVLGEERRSNIARKRKAFYNAVCTIQRAYRRYVMKMEKRSVGNSLTEGNGVEGRRAFQSAKELVKDKLRANPLSGDQDASVEITEGNQLRLSSNSQCSLSDAIYSFVEASDALVEQGRPRRIAVRKALQRAAIQALGARVKVHEYGSSRTGLALPDSDMDLCLIVEDSYDRDWCNMVSNLDQVAEQLRLSGFVNLHLVPAIMPVLKFTDTSAETAAGSSASINHNHRNHTGLVGEGRESPDHVIRFGDFANDDSGDESVVSDTGSSRSSSSFTSSSSSECSSSSSCSVTSSSEYSGLPLMVDVTCMGRNHHGLRAVNFVTDAVAAHPTLRPLVLVLKHLLSVNGLMDPITGGLTSHVIVLMALTFLVHGPSWPTFASERQQTKKGARVGPCSLKSSVSRTETTADPLVVENERAHAGMNVSLDVEPLAVGEAGGALLGFLQHYSCFDYEHWGVSTTRGFFLRGRHESAGDVGDLFIEDPFSLTKRRQNVAQSVYRVSQLKSLFASTLRDLSPHATNRQRESKSKPTTSWSSEAGCVNADGCSRNWMSSAQALKHMLGNTVPWQPVTGKAAETLPRTTACVGQPHSEQHLTSRAVMIPAHPTESHQIRTGGNMKTKRSRRRHSSQRTSGVQRTVMRPATHSPQPPTSPCQLSPPQPTHPCQPLEAASQLTHTQPSSHKSSCAIRAAPIKSTPSTAPAPTPNVSTPSPITSPITPPCPPKKVKGWGKPTVSHVTSPRPVVVSEKEWPSLGPSFPALPSIRSGNTSASPSAVWPVRRSLRSQ